MTGSKQVRVEEDGKVLGQASVSPPDEHGEARVQVQMASGHLPAGTRRKVTDAVHDTLAKDQTQHLTATVPIGDAELVEGLRDRLDDPELRAAGSTSIITGDLKPN